MDIEKARSIIQDLYIKHAIKEEFAAYKEGEIIKLLTENGFMEEEARKIIEEHQNEVISPYFSNVGETELIPNEPDGPLTPLYEIMDECDLAAYIIDTLSEQWDEKYRETPQKYIMEGTLDPTDQTEKLIRSIYAENKTKWPRFMQKHTLIKNLLTKGKTQEEAEKIIEEYQKRQILDYDATLPADVKQYKLKNKSHSNKTLTEAFLAAQQEEKSKDKEWINEDHLLSILIGKEKLTEKDAKKMIKENEQNLETRNKHIRKEGYEIAGLEDLIHGWAGECEYAQYKLGLHFGFDRIGSKNATSHTTYGDLREIFKEALNRGRKTLTYREITQKIKEKCGVTTEEADQAFMAALKTFKIRPEMEKNKNKKWEEKEYWWSGSCDYHPPRGWHGPHWITPDEDEEEIEKELEEQEEKWEYQRRREKGLENEEEEELKEEDEE